MNAIVPIPKVDVSVREATLADVEFIDRLQQEHDRQLGFLALSWIESKIKAGQVLVAVDATGARVGYIISQDKYLSREELGLIVQLCVEKGAQRNLIGATLVKAAFERAAYGCRLFCLWCAQDLAANRFWEAMGFVPLAYRAESEKKRRVHIFWQKRIRQDDVGQGGTPWWFPSKTGNGAMREDRIVLPIPPGKHWSDEMPRIEPVAPGASQPALSDQTDATKPRRAKNLSAPPASGPVKHGPRQFGAPPPAVAPVAQAVVAEKPKRAKKPKAKIDPKLLAAVRELRDRALEHFNSGAYVFEGAGKYDVTRTLPEMSVQPLPLLPAA